MTSVAEEGEERPSITETIAPVAGVPVTGAIRLAVVRGASGGDA